MCLLALPALFASAKVIDSAGNKFDMAQDVLATSCGRDYVAFGLNVTLDRVSGDISPSAATSPSRTRAAFRIITAGQVVNIRAAKVRNIYAAGGDVTVGSGTEVGGVYIVGANVTFSGTAQDVVLGGTSVTVDGTVYGNLTIRSDDITFGGDVTVGGKITVVGTVKPEMPPTIDESQVTFRRILARQKKDEPPKLGISRMAVIMSCVSLVTACSCPHPDPPAGDFSATGRRSLSAPWAIPSLGLLAFIVVPVVAFGLCLPSSPFPSALLCLSCTASFFIWRPSSRAYLRGSSSRG